MSAPGLSCLLSLAFLLPESSVESGVEEEIERLRGLVDTPAAAARPGTVKDREEALDRVSTMLASGLVAGSLERLGTVRQRILTDRFRDSHRATTPDIGALESLHEEVGNEMRRMAEPRPAALPAVIRALVEAERARGWTYHTASLEQGRATGVEGGLYYLGEARSHMDYARFLQELPFAEPGVPVPSLPGLDAFLEDIEAELLALYRPPAALGRHGHFIEASARLKFARELRDAELGPAALREALEARRGVHRLQSAGLDLDLDELAVQLDEHRNELESQDFDHSVATVLLESAEWALMNADDPRDDATSRMLADATIAVDHLVPAYLECTRSPSTPETRAAPRITVTLVRWPFT